MELRSTRKRKECAEFRELQTMLIGFGFYEPGMELQEMRQLVIAMQASMTQNLPGTMENDMEQALKDSELDFMPMQDVHNSTMISSQNTSSMERSDPVSVPKNNSFYRRSSSSPFSSPEASPQQLIIQAEVHHELNWSPPKCEPLVSVAADESRDRHTRKGLSTELETGPGIEIDAKRSRIEARRHSLNRTPTSESNDSGVSFSSQATSTSAEASESSGTHMTPPQSYIYEDLNEIVAHDDEDRDYDYHSNSAEPSL